MSEPLSKIRVLDLTRLLPGPYCSQMLADFGAEVIKVEEPETGDYARWSRPQIDDDYSALFASLNRNKKSVTLNLKAEEDRDVFLKLVESADVVIESFRPGVMDRLKLDYSTLKDVNPKLIYCAITGYGQTGPFKHEPGHDINYLSYSGLLHFQGSKGEAPTIPATQIADIGGGSLMAVVGILTALVSRNETGKGQFVDISMTDGVLSMLQTILPNFLASASIDNDLPLAGSRACYNVYKTADERYLSVGALEPKFWKAFCEGIEKPEFIPLLNEGAQVQEQLRKKIGKVIASKPLAKWLPIFEDIEACVSPVLTLPEVIAHPQTQARDMIFETDDAEKGKMKHVGIPIKLSDTPGTIRTKAPKLGEHNEEILAAFKESKR